MYNGLLDNTGVRGTDPLHGQKSVFNVQFPQNVTVNSLLLTGLIGGKYYQENHKRKYT